MGNWRDFEACPHSKKSAAESLKMQFSTCHFFLAVMSFLCVVFSRFCDGGRIFVFWCEDGVSGKIKYTYVYIYICILAFTFGINQHTTTSNSIGFCAVLCGFVLPWLPFSPCRNKGSLRLRHEVRMFPLFRTWRVCLLSFFKRLGNQEV